MIKFKSLNQSKDFLKILKKKRIHTKYFSIYFHKMSNNFKTKSNKSNQTIKYNQINQIR